MYITKLHLKNYGPIENLIIEPKFHENGDPQPLLLIGKNGSGKTLLLSNILDSFIEFKKQVYSNMPEIASDKLLKVGSTTYISPGQDYLYAHIDFSGTENLSYTDFSTKIPSQFKVVHPNLVLDGIDLSKEAQYNDGFYRNVAPSNKKAIEQNVSSTVLSYFPHSRYDHPEWLHNDASIGFKLNKNYLGHTNESVIKDNVISEVITWLLDCMLDKYLYETTTRQEPVNTTKNGQQQTEIWTVLTETAGKNTIILKLLNELLTSIYKYKFTNLQYARIGINQKKHRQIAILIKERDKTELEIAPTFSHLSSGEVMLISLFGSIIREYDKLGVDFNELSDIQGIVIIDEIDLHLHIEHQKNLLPTLIGMFPKVQFIISTHSPFFLLGMKDKFGHNLKLASMPLGNEVEIDDFCEVQEAYNIFVSGFNNFQKNYSQLTDRLHNLTKPLVITEGKTDWKHLKAALKKLKASGQFEDLNDFDFLEYEEEVKMGYGELRALCLHMAITPNTRKIICIFDRDEESILKSMHPSDADPKTFKDHGNNVYSYCIPMPDHRPPDHKYIAIEHYYTDDELATKDENGRQIFLSSEFNAKGRHNAHANIRHGNYHEIKKYTDENKSKIIETDVFNENDDNIALPKNDFAQYIIEEKAGFDKFGFTEFGKIFSIMKDILN